jgi:CheY-like chemotaxis protein
MPIMNGSETIQVIKSRWESIKIIGTSVENANEKNMKNKGADAFLLKDFLPEQLYQTIIDLVN